MLLETSFGSEPSIAVQIETFKISIVVQRHHNLRRTVSFLPRGIGNEKELVPVTTKTKLMLQLRADEHQCKDVLGVPHKMKFQKWRKE